MALSLRLWAAWATCTAPLASAAIVQACLPAWASLGADGSVNGTCPYGHALPGDITWSRHRYEESSLELYLALFWSYVPWLLVLVLVGELLLTRGTRALQFAGYAGVIVGLNELVWKHLIHQARPVGSCLLDCGMPSSHAMISVGLATLILLDLAFRVCPTDVHVLRLLQEELADSGCSKRARAFFSCLRLTHSQAISNAHFVFAATFWLILLGPVPASRIYLKDHSPKQVAIGATIGALEAVLWFTVVRRLSWAYREALGTPWPSHGWPILYHDCTVPQHEVLAQRLLEDPVAAQRAFEEAHSLEPRPSTPPHATAQCEQLPPRPPMPMPLLVGSGGERCGVVPNPRGP